MQAPLGCPILQKFESLASWSIFPFLLHSKAQAKEYFFEKIHSKTAYFTFKAYAVFYVATVIGCQKHMPQL